MFAHQCTGTIAYTKMPARFDSRAGIFVVPSQKRSLR